MIQQFENQLLAVLLLSLRIVPIFAFAPPFTLIRAPAIIRLITALSISAWLVSTQDNLINLSNLAPQNWLFIAMSELILGMSTALAFQITFAAIAVAGRTIDIQAGFGLALLIEPATRSQTPLIGTLFAYVTAVFFFSLNGPMELLAIWHASLSAFPLGDGVSVNNLSPLFAHISISFVIAIGLAAIVLLVLFLTDMTVAMLSKTLPQMQVLLLGFQAKAIMLLLFLPLTFATGSAIFLRLVRTMINSAQGLL